MIVAAYVDNWKFIGTSDMCKFALDIIIKKMTWNIWFREIQIEDLKEKGY